MSELAVVVQKSDIQRVFIEPTGLDPLLEQIAAEARSLVADPNTAKGRDSIRSMAYKVAQSKTYLDGLGKDLVAEMKEMPKKVDEHRRKMRDFLDALKDEVRGPLTAWEEEQARIEAEKKAAEEAAALAAKIEADHEFALLMNAEFDRKALEVKAEAERAEAERIERIKKEAAEKALRDAEEAAERERVESSRREAEAVAREERARREAAEAEARAAAAEQAAKEAAEMAEAARIAAEEEANDRAKREAEAAVERERKRVEDAKAAEAAEQDKRESDKAHRSKINREALSAIAAECGLSDDQAKAVVIAIASGKVPAVKIVY